MADLRDIALCAMVGGGGLTTLESKLIGLGSELGRQPNRSDSAFL